MSPWRGVDQFDARVDGAWEPLRGIPPLDRAFYAASEAGDFGLIWLAIGAAQAAFGPQAKIAAALRLAGVLAVESVLVNGVVKSVFRRERPAWEQDRPMPLRKPRTSSFPSGHATSAVTATILLSERAAGLVPLYALLAALVAWSRVHVKVHHASDVIGGLALGALIGSVAKRLWPLA